MKTQWLTLVLLIGLPSLSGSAGGEVITDQRQTAMQQTTQTPATQTEAASAVRTLITASIRRDLRQMDTLLAPTFTLTHITGLRQSRADWLAEIEQESMKYYSYREESCTTRQEGDRVIVTIRTHLDARIWGTRRVWPLQQIMTLQPQGDRWIILSSVASLF